MPTIPEFCPRFLDDNRFFEDGRMFAAIDLFETEDGDKGILIHEWSSNFPGNGHSEQALRWFRESGFSHISASQSLPPIVLTHDTEGACCKAL